MKILALQILFVLLLSGAAMSQYTVNGGSFNASNFIDRTNGQPDFMSASFRFEEANVWAAESSSQDNAGRSERMLFRGGMLATSYGFTYKAGDVFRGFISVGTGAYINYVFANQNPNAPQTEIRFSINPHNIPKLKPSETQVIVPVTFTLTGTVSIFAEPMGDPRFTATVVGGYGDGTVIYRRRNQTVRAFRRHPQAELYLAHVSFTFRPQP